MLLKRLNSFINWLKRPQYSVIDKGEDKLSSFHIDSGPYVGTEFLAKIVTCGFDGGRASFVIEFLSDPHNVRMEDGTLPKRFAKQVSAIMKHQALSNKEDIGMTLCKR